MLPRKESTRARNSRGMLAKASLVGANNVNAWRSMLKRDNRLLMHTKCKLKNNNKKRGTYSFAGPFFLQTGFFDVLNEIRGSQLACRFQNVLQWLHCRMRLTLFLFLSRFFFFFCEIFLENTEINFFHILTYLLRILLDPVRDGSLHSTRNEALCNSNFDRHLETISKASISSFCI